jgi:hypothetical protein
MYSKYTRLFSSSVIEPSTIGESENSTDDEDTAVTVGPLKYFCVYGESEAKDTARELVMISAVKKCFINNS